LLGASDFCFSRLMDRREAPGRKRMGRRRPDGTARHPISSPPAPFLLCHLLFSPNHLRALHVRAIVEISGGLSIARPLD